MLRIDRRCRHWIDKFPSEVVVLTPFAAEMVLWELADGFADIAAGKNRTGIPRSPSQLAVRDTKMKTKLMGQDLWISK